MIKRRIFISFDHADTDKVNGFLGLRNIMDGFEFYNHKLDHRIKSSREGPDGWLIQMCHLPSMICTYWCQRIRNGEKCAQG